MPGPSDAQANLCAVVTLLLDDANHAAAAYITGLDRQVVNMLAAVACREVATTLEDYARENDCTPESLLREVALRVAQR